MRGIWWLCPRGDNHMEVHSLRDLSPVLKLLPECEENVGALMCLRIINPNAGHVLGAFESGHFIAWDLRMGRVMSVEKLKESPMALDYDDLTNRGIYAGAADQIGVFAFQKSQMTLQERPEIPLKTPRVSCLRIRPDRKIFISGQCSGRVRVFSWKSLRPLAVLTEHKKTILDVAFSPGPVDLWKAPLMAIAGEDSQITLWDIYN
uniref:Uncharacterized protein n=1 Tax=Lutzomyia longipalpis TaxID=7200 RepID=A0A1B0CMA2_LUTLO